MAVSKSFLFRPQEQLASALGHALAHPARVVMLRRLISGRPVAYVDLIAGMPLEEATLKQHLRLLERLRFVEHALLDNNLAGFVLRMEYYNSAALAVRRQLRTQTLVRSWQMGESG